VNSYNRVMSITAPRRVGVAGLLGLLAGALVLMFAPGNPGALRVIGIGLFWWYAALAAPLAAVLLVVSSQGLAVRSGSGHHSMVLAIAAWTSPVLLALVAARGLSGGPDAPALALAALVAPLIAFLAQPAGGHARPNLVAALAVSAGLGFTICANLLLFADVAGLLGLPRWTVATLATLVALIAVELAQAADPGARRPHRSAASGRAENSRGGRLLQIALRGGGLTLLYTSALGFVALVAIIGTGLLVSPWGAWRDVASRPAITFGEHSPWVTEGRTLARPIALDFTEGHRVTALSPATYRVAEPGSLWGGEASRALLTGLGLAASATLGSRLAADEAAARLVGSVVGVVAFTGFSILASHLPTWASMIGAYPALAAVPLAWGVTRAWDMTVSRR
jgi:hypothetical protein